MANLRSGLSGAATGAAIGSSILPGIGTGIGAIGGGLWGLFHGKKNPATSNAPGSVLTSGPNGEMVTTAGLDNTDRTLEGRGDTFWDDYLGGRQRDQDQYADTSSGYKNFAATGGYSPEDLGAIRGRATGAVRSVFDSARRNIERSRNLSGYSPNYTAALSKVNREVGGAVADATTNADANIAQMVQAGKLQGLSGMSGLYSATPGQTSMYGNMAQGADRNWLSLQGLRSNYDSSTRDRELRRQQGPSSFDRNLGRAGSILDIAKRGASIWSGMSGS